MIRSISRLPFDQFPQFCLYIALAIVYGLCNLSLKIIIEYEECIVIVYIYIYIYI